MGLDTSHDCWHGPYGGFLRWRHALAEAAGYKIREPTPEERAEGIYSRSVDIHWEMFEAKNYQGEWGFVPGDDPLLFLIVHSDCDGVIHPAQGIHIARRLEQLLPLLDDPDAGWLQDRTRKFIDGLKAAAAAGEDVDFH
jgi:hypothetical protein